MSNLAGCIAICILILFISDNWMMFAFFVSISAIIFLIGERQALNPANRQTNPLDIQRYGQIANRIYPPNLMYQLWTPEILFSSRTRKNLKMAREEPMKIILIDQHNGVADIKDSQGQHYYTTLTSCTCDDFESSPRPCKHMLKLAHVTGALNQNDDLMPHEVVCNPNNIHAHN